MQRSKRRSNILCCLLNREAGITHGYKFLPTDKALLKYAEQAASLPNKNQHCELSGQPRSTLVMAFSRDCSRVASTHGDHTIRVTDVRSGKCTHVLPGHYRTPWCIAFHPSSNEILASGCLAGEVRIWDLQGGGSETWRSPEGLSVASLAFHPADNVLVFAVGNKLRFWSWKQPEPFLECQTSREYEKIRWVKFDPLGHTLYTGIANGSTVVPPDAHCYSGERNRSVTVFPDRHVRTAADETPNDGELSHLLNRSDYDQPGLSVQEDRDSQNVWTFNRGFVDQSSSGTTSSRYAPELNFWSEQATDALTNARRYAARETSRHHASADSSVSRAMAWETAPPWRRTGPAHSWDNPSVSDVSRRRNRLLNLVNNRSLYDLQDPPEWPYAADLRASNMGNVTAMSSDSARSVLGQEYESFLNSSGLDGGNQRVADNTGGGTSGALPSVVVTWENESAASRPLIDDAGPDNEAEEVTSTAAEAGSTASLGESIDADVETRSAMEVEASLSSGSEVAASGSLSSDPRFTFGSGSLSYFISPRRPLDWNIVSSDAAAAATARRFAHLPGPEEAETTTPRRWRRFTRRQAEVEPGVRRLRQDNSSSSASFMPEPNDHSYNSLSSLRSSDLPAGHELGDYAEDLIARVMDESTVSSFSSSQSHAGAGSSSVESLTPLYSVPYMQNENAPVDTPEDMRTSADASQEQSNSSVPNFPSSSSTAFEIPHPTGCLDLSGRFVETASLSSNSSSHSSGPRIVQVSSSDSSSVLPSIDRPMLSSNIVSQDLDQGMVNRPGLPQFCSSFGVSRSFLPAVSSGASSSISDLFHFTGLEQRSASSAAVEDNAPIEEPHTVCDSPVLTSGSLPLVSTSSSYASSSLSRPFPNHQSQADDIHSFSSVTTSNETMTGADSVPAVSFSQPGRLASLRHAYLNLPCPRTSSASSSSSALHPAHVCRPNCEVCSGSAVSITRCLAPSHARRGFPSRLSQITYDRIQRIRSSLNDGESRASDLRTTTSSGHSPVASGGWRRWWSRDVSRPVLQQIESRMPTASPQLFDSMPAVSSVNASFSSNESMIAEFEQRMRQVDERVSRIQLRLMEHAAWRREHLDNSRYSGLSDLRDRLRERQERMRAHLEELRSRFGRSASRAGDSSRQSSSLNSASNSDFLATGASISGFGSTGADAVGDFLANEDREIIVDRLRSIPNEIRMINVEMNRARYSRRPAYVWEDPSDSLADPSEDRVQAAINQAIHGAFVSNGGETSIGSNIIDQTFRIQAWDFAESHPPNLSDMSSNIIVHRAKLHNDASCDIALDGSLLCTFIQTSRSGFAGSGDITLGIFSLLPATRGQCLFKKAFGPNAISISLSPLNSYVLVGLASKRFSWIFTPKQIVAQVYRLKASQVCENSLEQVGDVLHSCDVDFRAPVSMNSARWMLAPGEGLVYGTNRGDLHICRPGVDRLEKPEADGELSADTNPVRQSLLQMLGLSAPRTVSAATQTGFNARRSASTQTEHLYAASEPSARRTGHE